MSDFFEKEAKNNAGLFLLAFPVMFFLLVVPVSLLYAWILQKMYGWFLLPLGAPELNIWHIWGITMMIQFFTSNPGKDEDGPVKRLVIKIVASLLMLLIGFLIKGYI